MIYDTIDKVECYAGMGEGIIKALRFVRDTDFSAVPDGRIDIDGDRLFANVMSYSPKDKNDLPESHQQYIDLQYLISGTELVGVAPLSDMTGIAKANPQGDIWLHTGETEKITLGKGRFMLLFPQDAHAPGIADGTCTQCRKCVVKIKL